jgi:hypothetical protein
MVTRQQVRRPSSPSGREEGRTEIVQRYPRYQRLVGGGSVEGEDFVQLGDGE